MLISARGVGIEVDDQGPASADPLLLIMGLGMQLVAWPQELVQLLITRGFRVLRMDNRDVGLSQGFDHLGVPSLAWSALRYNLRLPLRPPYTLADMAEDALAVLDALDVRQAHVCGASMGGMIAQHLAARHPERIRSLTLLMSTSGARHLPQPAWRVQRLLMQRPRSQSASDVVAHLEEVLAAIGSPAFPTEPAVLRDRLARMVARSWRPAGTARQLVAVAADGDRSPLLQRIVAPTRVIHGEDDALVPVAAGRDLVARISGAQADFKPGMGHDLPLQLLPHIADGIAINARRSPG
jgi:pimeloyl-ACP methyl ester carboxylesterase